MSHESARALTLVALLAGALSACGDDDGPAADAGPTADGAAADAGPRPAELTLEWGPVSVEPGVERTQCITVRLGNAVPVKVHEIHNLLSTSSHHLIVYRVSDETEQATPYDCQPFTDTLDPSKGAPLMITQKHDDLLTLPDGVAYSLAANQMIRLEMHYINTTESPLDATATSTFITMPESEFEHEAGFLFVGTPDIDLAPNASATVGPYFFPLPAAYNAVTFYALTGHTHQFGTDVRISQATGPADLGTPIYGFDGWLWNEPNTATFAPGLTVPAGSGFRFACDYTNTSNSRVGFGESATDEMCFFWAYYYPDQGPKVCVSTIYQGTPYNVCCPGDALCSFLPL